MKMKRRKKRERIIIMRVVMGIVVDIKMNLREDFILFIFF